MVELQSRLQLYNKENKYPDCVYENNTDTDEGNESDDWFQVPVTNFMHAGRLTESTQYQENDLDDDTVVSETENNKDRDEEEDET